MKFTHRSERGQAIILIVFGIIGLLAITALAIDAGNSFADRRHAQSAADTAAFATALEKIDDTPADNGNGIDWRAVGLARATSNGYSNDGMHTVVINNPPVAGCNGVNGPYAGNSQYYQVIIHSAVDTYFGSVIGIPQLNNCVEAISRVKPSVITQLAIGAAVAAMNCHGNNITASSGSTTVTLIGGGAFSNSDNASALYVQKLSNLITPMDKGLQAVGGITAPYGYPSPVSTGLAQFPCPLPTYMFPKYTCDYTYGDFPPVSSDGNVIVTGTGESSMAVFKAGIYCINGRFFKTGMRNTTEGIGGVTFVLLSTTVTEVIAWSGNSDITLNAPTMGPTKGLLIYSPYNPTDWSIPKPRIKLTGTSGLNISGSVFAPASLIELGGDFGNSAVKSQWVGAIVDMSGNLKATIQYDDALEYHFPTPPVIELTK